MRYATIISLFMVALVLSASQLHAMNKNDLVDAVAEKADLSKADATQAVDVLLEVISDALRGGFEVRLVGFGTFSVAKRQASEGTTSAGETIQIPAARIVKFKSGKGLKDYVNEVTDENPVAKKK